MADIKRSSDDWKMWAAPDDLLPEPTRPCEHWIARTRDAEAEVERKEQQIQGWKQALSDMTAARDAMEAAWEKDNLCGICPYRQAVQQENERLRAALRELHRAITEEEFHRGFEARLQAAIAEARRLAPYVPEPPDPNGF